MKKIKLISCILCLLVLLQACKDDNPGQLTASPSVIGDWELASYDLPAGDANPFLLRMHWTKTRFFSESGTAVVLTDVNYTVEASLAEDNFSNPVTVTSTPGLYFDVYAETLRGVLTQLGQAGNAEGHTVSFRVKGTGSGISAYSDAVSLLIKP